MNKIIKIKGKNNIDHLTKKKKERIIMNSSAEEITDVLQKECLNVLNNNTTKKLSNKLYSYKQQDIRRGILDDSFIEFEDLINKLKKSNLQCDYCKDKVKIIYRIVRDPVQWTLDRIDNDKGHSNLNTVICCLNCNLKKRRIKKEDFELSKKKIVKNN